MNRLKIFPAFQQNTVNNFNQFYSNRKYIKNQKYTIKNNFFLFHPSSTQNLKGNIK